jgi:hypothetical protein
MFSLKSMTKLEDLTVAHKAINKYFAGCRKLLSSILGRIQCTMICRFFILYCVR